MDTALYLSALTLGFLGSFHCAGMCGPIAFMLPKENNSTSKIIAGKLTYNAGRIVTYIFIGVLFGALGFAIALKGFQQELSVLSGVIILVSVILSLGKKQKLVEYKIANSYTSPLRRHLKKLFSKKSFASFFMIGIVNGLLPCGFVYLAAAGAVSTGSIKGSVLYMFLFGIGTFPMMMALSIAANYLGLKFRKIFTRVSPLIAIALALFLIYRGTDMKLPDNSHSQSSQQRTTINCIVPH